MKNVQATATFTCMSLLDEHINIFLTPSGGYILFSDVLRFLDYHLPAQSMAVAAEREGFLEPALVEYSNEAGRAYGKKTEFGTGFICIPTDQFDYVFQFLNRQRRIDWERATKLENTFGELSIDAEFLHAMPLQDPKDLQELCKFWFSRFSLDRVSFVDMMHPEDVTSLAELEPLTLDDACGIVESGDTELAEVLTQQGRDFVKRAGSEVPPFSHRSIEEIEEAPSPWEDEEQLICSSVDDPSRKTLVKIVQLLLQSEDLQSQALALMKISKREHVEPVLRSLGYRVDWPLPR